MLAEDIPNSPRLGNDNQQLDVEMQPNFSWDDIEVGDEIGHINPIAYKREFKLLNVPNIKRCGNKDVVHTFESPQNLQWVPN